MASSRTLSILLLSILLTAVNSQQNVVSVTTIQDGGTFRLYCDASRVTIPGDVTRIDFLKLSRQVGTDQTPTLIASYKSLVPQGVPSENKNPALTQWNVTFSGANGGNNNRNTMKIEVMVPSAQCNDAGLYICDVTYYDSSNIPASTDRKQNVSSEPAAELFTITPNPDNRLFDSENPNYSEYSEGDFVTITCRVDGPQDLGFSWYQRSEDGFGNNFFAPYPYTNDITTPAASPKPGATCNEYQHQTTLSLNLTILNDQITYKCGVNDQGQEIMSGNVTIGITSSVGSTPNNQAPATAGGGDDNTGMIVGIVIGCVALIVIIVIVVVVVIKKRKSRGGDKYVERDAHDGQADPNLHAPPPVFYSKPSKPPKDEKDNAYNHGMTNDALDTSYDSKDSANRGPPRYTNTGPEINGPPRYENETHRGRHNRGYDEEDRERSGRRPPREERRSRSRDLDDEPRSRRYSTEDGTDDRGYNPGIGDPSIGTAI